MIDKCTNKNFLALLSVLMYASAIIVFFVVLAHFSITLLDSSKICIAKRGVQDRKVNTIDPGDQVRRSSMCPGG